MNVPAKIQRVLDEMTERGLEVTFHDDRRASAYVTVYSWTISSPVWHERDAVFIHWVPGKNGGRVSFTLYRPYAKKRSSAVKVTRDRARRWLIMLADSIPASVS
jgi:hypothetical protein